MAEVRVTLDVDDIIDQIDTHTLAQELNSRHYGEDDLRFAVRDGDIALIREIINPRRTPEEWRTAYARHMAEQRASAP